MIVETFAPQEKFGDPEWCESVYSSFLIADGCKEHAAALWNESETRGKFVVCNNICIIVLLDWNI
jgi:uncharacterized CHY-type Zn-finger protein